MEGKWSASRPCSFNPRGTYWIGGWVGPRACLDDVQKKNVFPCGELNANFSVFQPVA
jgi:hypothetical protein